MRRLLRDHGPVLAALAAMLVLAGTMASLIPAAGDAPAGSRGGTPAQAIELPGPEDDADGDSYADAVDLADGDRLVRIDLLRLQMPGRAPEPYVVVGTQDDQWRTGAGDELEWRHVVDHDSLGRKPGSPAWYETVVRTGTWVATRPGEGLDHGAGATGSLGSGGDPAGTRWPQSLFVNVRDDRPSVRLSVEAWDGATSPHRPGGAWELVLHLNGSVEHRGRWTAGANATLRLGTLAGGAGPAGLELAVAATVDLGNDLKAEIAGRWAPDLHFDTAEVLYPVAGDVLEQMSGFTRSTPELRTWTLAFNNGRDGYRLALPFDSGGTVDHRDVAQLLSDLAASGSAPAPTVYAHVARATQDHVVVQYWFLYLFNYVQDDAGRDIPALAHAGDREFIQLEFASVGQALNGTPLAITYSQHYKGVRVDNPTLGSIPLAGGWPDVYVAGGSHASYPAPGDDRALRPAFAGFHDEFDGDGFTMTRNDYVLEVLGAQRWHMGYLWGPVTRHGRQLGTSFQPLLQHDFRYAFQDPLYWQASIESVPADQLEAMYGSRTE